MISKRFYTGFALCAVTGAAIVWGCLGHRGVDSTTLHILHTNDLHAHLVPWHQDNASCAPNGPTCRGGFAQIKTVLDTERKKHPDALTVDVGDRFSGTVFYTFRKSRDLIDTLSGMGYDVFIPGNHEFDDGLPELVKFVTEMPVPFVASNLDFPPDTPLGTHTKRHIVLERNGTRIGIVGAVTEDVKKETKGGANTPITPVTEAICREAATLKDQGINIIIALTHIGLPKDKQLAKDCPDVDIIIGGHTHALLSNNPAETAAVDRYPILIPHTDGTQTAIVTAGIGGHHVGALTAQFNKRGELVGATGETIPVEPTIQPDTEIQSKIAAAQNALADLLHTPLTTTEKAFPLTPNQHFCSENCAVGDVLASLALSADPNAEIALMNSGGIRAGLPNGTITVEHLAQAYPFDSELVTVQLTGREIADTIQRGIAQYLPNDRTNTLAVVAGLSYTFDGKTKTVTDIQTKNGTLNPDKKYMVVMPSFLADGGDGFPKAKPIRILSPSVRDMLIEQMKNGAPHRQKPHITRKDSK